MTRIRWTPYTTGDTNHRRKSAIGTWHDVPPYAASRHPLPPLANGGQDSGSVASSRRSNGRARPAASAARPAQQKRGLGQTRRAIRPPTPEELQDESEEEEEEGEEEEGEDEDDTSTVVEDDRENRLSKSGLAKEVPLRFPHRDGELTRRRI
jgi:hypothetical protein